MAKHFYNRQVQGNTDGDIKILKIKTLLSTASKHGRYLDLFAKF